MRISEYRLRDRTENIRRMVELGVMQWPEYWRGVDNIRHLDQLFANAGRILQENRHNGIADLSEALGLLEAAGIIYNPEYWENQLCKSQWLERLLINMANRVRAPREFF